MLFLTSAVIHNINRKQLLNVGWGGGGVGGLFFGGGGGEEREKKKVFCCYKFFRVLFFIFLKRSVLISFYDLSLISSLKANLCSFLCFAMTLVCSSSSSSCSTVVVEVMIVASYGTTACAVGYKAWRGSSCFICCICKCCISGPYLYFPPALFTSQPFA